MKFRPVRFRGAAVALGFVLMAFSACTPEAPPAGPPPGTVCTGQRPQMCTRDYRPVCGSKRDGTRQTYGNGCSACADANVVSHIPGPCS